MHLQNSALPAKDLRHILSSGLRRNPGGKPDSVLTDKKAFELVLALARIRGVEDVGLVPREELFDLDGEIGHTAALAGPAAMLHPRRDFRKCQSCWAVPVTGVLAVRMVPVVVD